MLRDPRAARLYREDRSRGRRPADRPFATRAADAGATTPTKGAAAATTAGNAAAGALYDSGMEHLKAQRHHEAVEAFRQAARLVPGEADFRAALGWSLFREAPADARAGRAALAELRRAIQIDEQNLRALHYLANYFAETGQPDLAIEELERILQIDPDSAEAAEAADQLRRLRMRFVRRGICRAGWGTCSAGTDIGVALDGDLRDPTSANPRHLLANCAGHPGLLRSQTDALQVPLGELGAARTGPGLRSLRYRRRWWRASRRLAGPVSRRA